MKDRYEIKIECGMVDAAIVVDTLTGKEICAACSDAPEDASVYRDYAPMLDEMNALASALSTAERERDELAKLAGEAIAIATVIRDDEEPASVTEHALTTSVESLRQQRRALRAQLAASEEQKAEYRREWESACERANSAAALEAEARAQLAEAQAYLQGRADERAAVCKYLDTLPWKGPNTPHAGTIARSIESGAHDARKGGEQNQMSGQIKEADLSDYDRRALDKFKTYCRLISEADRAGVKGNEAAVAIYPGVYGTMPECDCEQCAKFKAGAHDARKGEGK